MLDLSMIDPLALAMLARYYLGQNADRNNQLITLQKVTAHGPLLLAMWHAAINLISTMTLINERIWY